MMAPVKNAGEAINIGDNFVARYHYYKKLLTCNLAEDWALVYDVGVLRSEYVKLRLDPETGEVLEYTNHGAEKP